MNILSRQTAVVALCFVAINSLQNVFAADTLKVELNEITVTASRVPESVLKAGRNVEIIDSLGIQQTPSFSITDVLAQAEGVDLRKRGDSEIQADAGIGGGTFEQTAILIDGGEFNNAQTGHHNLNVPLTLFDIRRIEILKGGGASLFGPGAFNGAINFIPVAKAPNSFKLKIAGGSNGFISNLTAGNYSIGNFFNHFSFQREKSNGYRYNTDFNFTKFNYILNFIGRNFSNKIYFGFFEKHFGANGFYSVRFPNQRESTITRILNTSTMFKTGYFDFNLRFSLLSTDDDFILDFRNPSFYHNIHKTNQIKVRFQTTYHSFIGITSAGLEKNWDIIRSNNLGNRKREQAGFFLSHVTSFFNVLRVNFNAFAYYYSNEGWRFFPEFDINWRVIGNLNLFINWGRAFRLPSFTELYYNDPVTAGNRSLKTEKTINLEAGLKFRGRKFFAGITVFNRNGSQIIDWVKPDNSSKWFAKNISSLNTMGADVYAGFNNLNPIIKRLSFGYSFITSDKKSGGETSKYAFDFLKNQLIISLSNNFLFGSNLNWQFRFIQRSDGNKYSIVDFSFVKIFNPLEFSVVISNLFNISYYDISGVKLPSRQIKAALTVIF